jgi:hypothetical protein
MARYNPALTISDSAHAPRVCDPDGNVIELVEHP